MIETNLFPILNLNGLRARFRIYRIRGLRPDQPEFHQNCQQLRRIISREVGFRPIDVIKRSDGAYLALSEGCTEPPVSMLLIRGQVAFEKTDQDIEIDFDDLTTETQPLALRLLQYAVQDKLSSDGQLWRPGTGGMYFEKAPCEHGEEVGLHRGFVIRVAPLPNGGLGLCVDLRSRFISLTPLSPHLSRKELGRVRMHTFVYHYGHLWYEIQISDISEFNIQTYLCGESNAKVPLLDWVLENCQRPLPHELATLEKEGAVLEYETQNGDRRGAPAELCFEVFDTQAAQVRREHRRTILAPRGRHSELEYIVQTYLSSFRLGQTSLRLNPKPVLCREPILQIPDYRFGNNKILSVRGTPGAFESELHDIGRNRLNLLEDTGTGFYTNGSLYRQFVVLPNSVYDSWGQEFINGLCKAVNRLYPTENGYDPEIISYDDRRATNYVLYAQTIVKAVEDHQASGGYAVVMLPDGGRRAGYEDELAAMVIAKLGRHDLICSNIHASSAGELYEFNRREHRYEPRKKSTGRLRGYLRNVALNKVLLSCSKWPFILADQLHADVVVGIDVKGNTAGFTAISNTGEFVFTRMRASKQKEKLLSGQCRQYLADGIGEIAKQMNVQPREIVIHRDGRLFEQELEGIVQAIGDLKGIVSDDARLTCVEIPKTSFTSVRLFQCERWKGKRRYRNPEIGSYLVLGENDGYLCTTGNSFIRAGTAKPLHIRRVYGEMPIRNCLADVFSLASLTWTQPEGCSRQPISIKLNDRQLFESATQFDDDAYEFASQNERKVGK